MNNGCRRTEAVASGMVDWQFLTGTCGAIRRSVSETALERAAKRGAGREEGGCGAALPLDEAAADGQSAAF
jgi:hypothetical protein